MARTTSTRSKRTKKTEDTPVTDAETVAATDIDDAVSVDDADPAPETMAADTESEITEQDAGSAGNDTLATDAATAETAETAPESAPTPAAPPPAQRGGAGFVPLLIGGVLAAGVGYGAAYLGVLSAPSANDDLGALASAVDAQSQTLESLQSELLTLANAEPLAAPEVDLSPVLAEIAAVAQRLDGTTGSIEDLAGRLTLLEERPVFTGEVDQDSAAMAAAVEQLQNQLREQETRNEALAAELRNLADEAQAELAAAQNAIAEAEARAQESVAAATAQAALSRIRIAMAAGDPFGDALAELPEGIALPEALSTAAETGVPTLPDLQASFPAAARAALPLAIRDSAGESATDRLGAFLRGQIGGRSLEPREGDDPDAILSRAQAAINAGDLDLALTEVAALPDIAQAEMGDWTAAAQARRAADAALDGLAAALGGTN